MNEETKELEELRALVRKQKEEIARLERMLEVSRELNSRLNLHELLTDIQVIATALTVTEASSIMLVDKKTGELYFEAATGEASDELTRIAVPIDNSIAGEVLKTGKPLIVADVRKDPRHYNLVDSITKFSTKSILAVPLIVKDKTIGVVEVVNKLEEGGFTEEDVEVLTTMAAQAAVAIENARLFEQSDLISEVVHELRTPVTSIVGYAQMLKLPDIPEDSKQQFADIIRREAVRLGNMVNDFLEWARLESGRVHLSKEPIDMRALAEETILVVRPQADMRDITMSLQAPDEIPTVVGDAKRLKQVLLNLMSNAVKYNRDGGWVDVKIAVSPEMLNVSVSDTGYGIAPEDLPHIFQRFYRVASTEEQVKGTGLGLCIAKQIVEMHGGTMDVESQLGVGTTFSFTLPIT
ncbi:MAG: HAMP domain-containing histidine kinase [Anaerolineae bacterium]|jgi:signal transduction histidine kinase|nr:HAMP domain-containing histidine kinase [Anaerolineae bacterium]MDH7474115.1 HAMP domain-containing sensor histidine kinase [Anaerolineae bacterium]